MPRSLLAVVGAGLNEDITQPPFVHEVVHGVLHQNAAGRTMDQVASEYLAHALQIASLPPAVRDAFLGSMPAVVRTDDLVFSDIMLSLSPYLFAARAYQHLTASSDQCRRVRSLLQGSAAFIASRTSLTMRTISPIGWCPSVTTCSTTVTC